MAEITFTIDNNKIPRIANAMKGLYPIPKDDNGDPLFTDNQWVKEKVRRWIRDQVARWETKVARDAVNVLSEDDIIS